jgi:hypothetical protein
MAPCGLPSDNRSYAGAPPASAPTETAPAHSPRARAVLRPLCVISSRTTCRQASARFSVSSSYWRNLPEQWLTRSGARLLSHNFWLVTLSQVAMAIAGASIDRAVAGITLGMVRPAAFNRQNGHNQALNDGGNMVGASLSGLLGWQVRLHRRVLAGTPVRHFQDQADHSERWDEYAVRARRCASRQQRDQGRSPARVEPGAGSEWIFDLLGTRSDLSNLIGVSCWRPFMTCCRKVAIMTAPATRRGQREVAR